MFEDKTECSGGSVNRMSSLKMGGNVDINSGNGRQYVSTFGKELWYRDECVGSQNFKGLDRHEYQSNNDSKRL